MSDLDGLPELLALAGEAGGIEAARGLAKAFGGKRIWIPKKASDGHPLVVAAGRKAANVVMQRYGGEQVQFPNGKRALNKLVVEKMADQSTNMIAAALGLTYRQAHRLRKALGPAGQKPRKRISDPRQLDIEDLIR